MYINTPVYIHSQQDTPYHHMFIIYTPDQINNPTPPRPHLPSRPHLPPILAGNSIMQRTAWCSLTGLHLTEEAVGASSSSALGPGDGSFLQVRLASLHPPPGLKTGL